ncbi:hypothetical protein F1188_07270 [Roseospira marina]|uniref:Cytochrome C oxidase subunit I n=1 Tax=Roseospira marina TaxID=140057 RepID=A0A5M6IES5_9PROT|nr:hypothetical protein [Roseospira marina]KAA5606215.1 hypothetical protein F1188_07270 [Roseospira marina]MBB4314364.1 hypothetical protein [Roseospira marina]MBB5087524.1 hypothetical protein [Roseospira marina]
MPFDASAQPIHPDVDRPARAWGAVAIAALALAGLLAVLLALARVPGVQDWLPWPWESFFRRALVTHVTLSVVVWFLAVLGLLAVLGAGRVGRGPAMAPWARAGWMTVAAGMGLLLGPAVLNLGAPSLNNYVPVVDHPLYHGALGVVALGVALPLARLLSLGPRVLARDMMAFGAAMGALTFAAALVCVALAALTMTPEPDPEALNEWRFWAGGHVLQFVNALVMLTLWHHLSTRHVGRAPLPTGPFAALLALIALVAWVGPLVFVWAPVQTAGHYAAFTLLYKAGLTLQPAILLIATAWMLVRARGVGLGGGLFGTPGRLALVGSVVLFAAGGVLGFLVGWGDTRTPAHYHAIIAGVNLAVMGLFLGGLVPSPRVQRRPTARLVLLWLYAVGSLVQAVGLYGAGVLGVGRKLAGEAQGLDSTAKSVFMGLNGAGGGLAALGGVMFVWIVLAGLIRQAKAHAKFRVL